MPVEAGVQVVKLAIQCHVDFANDGFLGRCPVESDSTLDLVFFHRGFEAEHRAQRAGTQARMATGVACGSGFQRFTLWERFLRHAWQRIVFGQDADDRSTFTIACHERSRHSGDAAFDAEAGSFEFFN